MKIHVDRGFLMVVLFLLGLGLVQVYSSSYIFAIESFGSGLHFFTKQLMFACLGIAVLLVTAVLPWKLFENWGILIWAGAAIGVALTFVPGLGITAGGATRWLQLPLGQRFEPAELLKIGYSFLLATLIAKDFSRLGKWLWPFRIAIVCSAFVLLLKQPDFGSFFVCFTVSVGILFAFGMQWRYLIAGLAAAVPAFYFLIVQVPYRYARIQSFLDPWADPSNKGFQVIQSLLSFRAGGLWGQGLGQGQGKLFFLPEAHTDFTLAVLGEELGFVGVLLVLLMYAFIIYKGFQIALKTEQTFPKAVAIGISLSFGLSVFINFGVVMGLLPTKGLTLPFLSYGGSSLVVTCFAMGLLMNIHNYSLLHSKKSSFAGMTIK